MAFGDKVSPAKTQTWQPRRVGPELGSVSAESGFDGGFLPGAAEHLPGTAKAGCAGRERNAGGRSGRESSPRARRRAELSRRGRGSAVAPSPVRFPPWMCSPGPGERRWGKRDGGAARELVAPSRRRLRRAACRGRDARSPRKCLLPCRPASSP